MKHTLATLFMLAALVVAGCRDWYPPVDPRDPVDPPPTYSLTGTRWCLQVIESNGTGEVVDPKLGIFLNFVDGASFKGFGGCNNMGGSYVAAGNQLTITDLYSTDMACGDAGRYEAEFSAALMAAKTYTINGAELRINCGGVPGTTTRGTVLVFTACDNIPVDPPVRLPFERTRWCLQKISLDDGATSTVVDPSYGAYVEFDGSGQVTGFGSCNGFGGDYQIKPNQGLYVGNLVGTKIWCGDGKGEVENQYMALLGSAMSYEVTGDQLIIYTASLLNSRPTQGQLVFQACSVDPNPGNCQVDVMEGKDFDLPYGCTAVMASAANPSAVKVQIVDVKDSRCPFGATCIREGSVAVTLTASTPNTTSTVTLELGENGIAEREVDGFRYTLVQVRPYLPVGQTAELKDYIAVLHIVRI